MKPRFLLDEHINPAIQRQLLRLDPNIEVLVIGQLAAPSKGTPDPDLLLWLEEYDYVLVTENRSTIPVHLANHFAEGRHIPGIFWLRPLVIIGKIIEELYLIWLVSTAAEYQDRTLFIPF
jgi:hypothetical protein